MASIEELEAQLAADDEAFSKAEREQYAVDLQAKIEVKREYENAVATVKVSKFKRGQPTLSLLRMPNAAEYKRYVDQVTRAAEQKKNHKIREAQETLAKACWVYPKDKEAQDSMLDAFPGLLTTMANAASELAEGKAQEEGKG